MIQHKAIRYKVFIEGIDVTSKVASISSIKYEVNNIQSCSITLECDQNEFIVTESDLVQIKSVREGTPFIIDFNNALKNAFLVPLVNKKMTTLVNRYLYEFGLGSCIIPINANVRVFEYLDGTWYYAFTGVTRGRSTVFDSSGRNAVTLRCSDVLNYLRMSTISTSFGIWEPITVEKIAKEAFGLDSTGSTPTSGNAANAILPGNISPEAMQIVPNVRADYNTFGMPGSIRFLEALVYAIFGEVDLVGLSGYSMAAGDTYEVKVVGTGQSITRNRKSAGLFTLENIKVGVFGEGAVSFIDSLRKGTQGPTASAGNVNTTVAQGYGSGWDIFEVKNLDEWDKVGSGNTVIIEDLVGLCVLGKMPDGAPTITSMEDVVNYIGANSKIGGLYDTSGGSLKVLLPGSLIETVYTMIKPDTVLDTHKSDMTFNVWASRLQILSTILSMGSNFVYYASPKGNIIVEFPMYDVEDYGVLNQRVYSKNDWQGSFSDTEDFDSLYSASRQVPQGGAVNYSVDGSRVTVEMAYQAQGAINSSIFEKIGLRMYDGDVLEGMIPINEAEAQYKAELKLGMVNRKSYGGSIVINFNPRIMINRSVKFSDIGRAAVVFSQTFSLAVGEAVGTTVVLEYMRQRGADGLYNIAYGSLVTDIDVDYARFFGGKPKAGG